MKTTMTALMVLGLAATAGAQTFVYEQRTKDAADKHAQLMLTEEAVAQERLQAARQHLEMLLADGTASQESIQEAQKRLQVLSGVEGGVVHLSVESNVVSDAPYSAEAVTEVVQALSDGNRIVKRTVSRVYRDGKGRTRRETLNADGQVTSIVISDPVAHTGYSLDPSNNTARRIGVAVYVTEKNTRELKLAGGSALIVASEGGKTTLHATTGRAVIAGGTESATRHTEFAEQSAASTKEDLGVKSFDGVEAKGARTTTVIPAGAIGNEMPITITSEEWTSPDLKVLLMTRHADPRSGETTYRLTGINRAEPPPSLFEVPAGYTIK